MKKTLTVLLSIFAASVFAQDTIRISGSEIDRKSLDKNLQLQLAQKEIELSEAELLITRAMYLPDITASYTVMNTNSPLNAFGFKLNQSRIAMEDFNPEILNDPKSITDFGPKIEIQQPIVNLDMVYQKKAGSVTTEVLKIKQQRTEEYLRFELSKGYYMLQLAYKVLNTLEDAKSTTLANKKVIDNYYANGLVQKSDVLYMEVRVSEIDSQIQFAKSNIQNASDYLFLLLNEDSDGKIFKPTEELSYGEIISENNFELNPNRKDLQAYQKSLEAYEWMIKSSKSKFLPRLNAFGSFELHDNKFTEFDGKGYLIGLQLSWNFFDGLKSKSEQIAYKADYNRAKAEIDQYTQQSSLELKKAYRQIQDADKKVELTESAWNQSKEAYRIRKNRYDQGLEKSADLLTAETLMAQKELEYQQSIFEYNTAVAYFKFLKD
ncbi:MAG: TolC family protein [Flavobacteriia bacterium]|nr:TolC family protein [Flavobacteriia bacterium]